MHILWAYDIIYLILVYSQFKITRFPPFGEDEIPEFFEDF